jgi:hypothetical protein
LTYPERKIQGWYETLGKILESGRIWDKVYVKVKDKRKAKVEMELNLRTKVG